MEESGVVDPDGISLKYLQGHLKKAPKQLDLWAK